MAIKKFETQDGIKLTTDDDFVDENGNSLLGGGSISVLDSNDNETSNVTAIAFTGNATVTNPEPGLVQVEITDSNTATARTYYLNDYGGIDTITTPTEIVIDGMSYNGGSITTDGAFGEGSSRVVCYQDSVFAMIATNTNIDAVYYNGETGSDGSGSRAINNATMVNYRGYSAVQNVLQGNDPAIIQMVIFKAFEGTVTSSYRSEDTNNDDWTVSGLTGSTQMAVVNFYLSAQDPEFIDNATPATAAIKFVDYVFYGAGATELTSIVDLQQAFTTNFAAMKAEIEAAEGYTLFEDFEFYEGEQVVRPTGGTGSGFLALVSTNAGGSYSSEFIIKTGSGYTDGDELTVSGTEFGGTSPANDVTITVTVANGEVTGFSASGTAPSEVWPGSFILDGEDDQYDTGNFIGTNITRVTATVTVEEGPFTSLMTVISADKDIALGQFAFFEGQNRGDYIVYADSYGVNNTAEYFDASTGYTSTQTLDYDFHVDVDRAHITVNGDGSWDIGSNANNTKIFSIDELDPGFNDIIISAGSQNNNWMFDRNGNITLPAGGDIRDSNGNSVLGAGTLTDDHEVTVTVGNTEYFAIINRANNNDNGVEASGVAYDSEDNMITLHISEVYNNATSTYSDHLIISKFSSAGTLLWQKQITQDVDDGQTHDLAIDGDDNIFVAASVDNGNDPDTVDVIKLNGSTGAILWQKEYKSTIETNGVAGDLVPVDYTPFSTTLPGVGTPAQGLAIIGNWANIPVGWTFRSSPGNGTYTTLGTILGVQYNSGTDQTTLYFAPATLNNPLPNDPTYYSATGLRNSSTIEVGAMVLSGTDIFVASGYQEGDGLDYVGHLMKLSATDGTLNWAVIFDLLAETDIYGMDVTTGGDPVVVGVAFPDGAPPAFYATRLSGTDGAGQWTQILFDPISGVEYSGADIVIDSQNNIFVSVNSRQTIVHDIGDNTYVTIAHIVKLNSSGVIQWTRRVGPGPCGSVATGIDCDSTGNVYLSAVTAAQSGTQRETQDYFDTARNVLALAKYNTSGAVLWQRYIESDTFYFIASRDEDSPPGNYDNIQNRGRCMSINNSGKLAIQVTAVEIDADDNIENSVYTESITFQIDQDGRTMTVGSGNAKFTVKESRIPGRFITLSGGLETDPALPNSSDFAEDMSVTDPELSLADGELAQVLIKSAAYEYVFGNNGTLSIPNDGDIKLTQTQLGWFSIFGRANNDNYDLWIRANCVDPATGCVYAVGQDDDDSRGFIAKYDVDGNILWSVKLDDDDNGSSSRCNAVKIDPDTGNIYVLAEYYGNVTTASIIQIDPDTAKVVRSAGFKDDNDNGACVPFDFEITSSGGVVVVGRKFDELGSTLVTAQTGSGVGRLFVLRSAVAGTPNNSDWYVSGGSITGRTAVDNVDRYPGLTSTVRQGSGSVTININDNGDGTYSLVSFNAEGTSNYLVGHKLKVLGSLLGGADGVNDAVLTISAIDPGGVIESIPNTIEGTAAGVAPASYTNVAAINYQTGSGCTATLRFSTDGSISDVWSFDTAGSNYVIGDVLTFAGTQFPGGTSPTNDITMTVIDNGAVNNGVNGTNTLAGSIPTTYWRIGTTAQTPDYSVGSYSLLSSAGAEAFIVKGENNGQGEFDLVWTKVLGGGSTNDDRYFSVATDSSGNWYAAGEVYAQNNAAGNDLNSYWCAVISKFNSSGEHQWTKYLNNNINDCYARAVSVQGNTVAVTHENNNNGRTVITKLDLSGNIKWQRETNSGDDSSVAVDTNGDIYVVAETFMESQYGNCIKVIRLNSYGEIVWRKILATQIDDSNNTDEKFKNGRNLTIDSTHLYVSGYTSAFDNNYDSGFLVKIPKSGDADGIYGGWTVMNDAYDVDKVNSTEAGSFNPVVSIGEFETVSFDWSTNWFDPSGDNYYHTLEIIRDRDGGAIEFADGTRQTSSAQQIPQKKISNGADHRLSLEDMGRHIYVTNSNTKICVPYHQDNPLPVGFTVVIINNSGGIVSIDGDGLNMFITVPGATTAQYWDLESPGMATLIKVDDNTWFMTGNVTVD